MFRFCLVPILLLAASSANGWSQQRAVAPIIQPGAPGQDSKILSPATAGISAREPTEADTKFTQGMILHHAQAVQMTALMSARTRNKALLAFGKRISISQTDEMNYMKQWLEDRGKPVPTEHDQMMHMNHMPGMTHSGQMDMSSMGTMPGMLTPEQMKALAKASGATFDRLFLTGMIQHHTGALVMVDDLFGIPGAGQDSQLFDFATDVENTQSAEINIMKNILK
ncbi:MAG TPA: DUF305 domain-containing protein, partial [Candidatus Angelobacter sp.]|nr:DUF305 domain-containing protein [Candidatus Angelobacter sp.]